MLFDQVISQFISKDDPMIRTYSKDSFSSEPLVGDFDLNASGNEVNRNSE